MRRRRRFHAWRSPSVVVAAATVAIGFGSATAAGSSSVPLSNPLGYRYGYKAAVAVLPKLYAGTNTQVNTTPRPAAKNKFVVIISAGQSSISNSVPVDAAAAAAQAIGWHSRILDGTLEPSRYGGLVSQAIAMGANGIVLEGIDCDQVQGPLQQAKARHVVVVPLNAYDCDDPTENAGPSLFSAVENEDNLPDKSVGSFAESYGRAQADDVIAQSHNKARVLVLIDSEDTALSYSAAGFDDQIAHSRGSKVVATLTFPAAELGAKLEQEIRAQLVAHPAINWITSPDTYATILGVVPAIGAFPTGRYNVMGGEGSQPELADITAGTVTAALAISPQWVGWASIDTMNSVFTHKPVYPSGIGWELVDSTHNLPTNGVFVPKQNFETAYEKAWGVKT